MIVIEKYSDYSIQSVNYFKEAIENDINARDIKNLSNDVIDFVKVSKEHPLVTMMASQLGETRNSDLKRSNLLPAIAITPGSAKSKDYGFGLTASTYNVDDSFIADLKLLYNLPDNKTLQTNGLITKQQLENIMGAYKRRGNQTLRCYQNQWGREEELNISCWSESPDLDALLDNIVNSVLSGIRAKFPGDDSPLKNMKFETTRGLTNFNFGRVLFGTEYSLTFLNTYNNYTIFSERPITDFEADLTYIVPGEKA